MQTDACSPKGTPLNLVFESSWIDGFLRIIFLLEVIKPLEITQRFEPSSLDRTQNLNTHAYIFMSKVFYYKLVSK